VRSLLLPATMGVAVLSFLQEVNKVDVKVTAIVILNNIFFIK
jgi:uncharacterized membrane protein